MFDKTSPFAAPQPPGPTAKGTVAVQVLRHALLTGEIPPGATFSEIELEARFRLGRAGIRGALAILAGERLVTALPRQGWRANPISGAFIGDVVAARRRLEPLLAEVTPAPGILARLTPLAMLDAAIAGRHDPQALVTARVTDRQILDLLAESLGPFERHWLSELWDHSLRVLHFLERGEIAYRALGREKIIASVAAGDRKKAAAEILREIAHFETFVMQALLKRPDALQSGSEKRTARRVKSRAAASGPDTDLHAENGPQGRADAIVISGRKVEGD